MELPQRHLRRQLAKRLDRLLALLRLFLLMVRSVLHVHTMHCRKSLRKCFVMGYRHPMIERFLMWVMETFWWAEDVVFWAALVRGALEDIPAVLEQLAEALAFEQ